MTLPPYRAPMLRYTLAATGIFAGFTLTFADESFRHSTSLVFASHFLPLQVWGWALFVYAFLLITDIGDLGRICGFALGAGIAAFFAVSYGWTTFHAVPGKGRNGVTLAFLIDVVVFHIASIRVTVQRKIGPQ